MRTSKVILNSLNYKKNSRSELFFFISVWLILFYYYTYYNREENEFALSVASFKLEQVPDYEDPNRKQCYESYAFSGENMNKLFLDMINDDKLKNSNGQNIFFHLSNCIHDGIPKLNMR